MGAFGDSAMLVGKAVTASTATTAYRNANVVRYPGKFFRLIVDQTGGLLSDVKTVPVDGPSMQLDNATMTIKLRMGGGETSSMLTDPADDSSSATFSGRALTPVHCQAFLEVSTHEFPYDNLEGEQAQTTLQDMLAIGYRNGIEEITSVSVAGGTDDDSGGTDKYSEIDGWFQLAESGHVLDAATDYDDLDPEVFLELAEQVPSKWLTPNFKFYAAPLLLQKIRRAITRRGTAMADDFLIDPGTGDLRIGGYVAKPGQYIETDLDGVHDKTGTLASYSQILFADPANMILGYRPEMMKMNAGLNYEQTLIGVSLWGYWGIQYQNIDAVAKAVNVPMALAARA
jgi:hypothetical protein